VQRHILCSGCCSCRQKWPKKVSCLTCWTWASFIKTGAILILL